MVYILLAESFKDVGADAHLDATHTVQQEGRRGNGSL